MSKLYHKNHAPTAKLYYVHIREVHVSTREVEADSPEEALEKVKDGDGEETMCEYSHTLDDETWTVEDAEGNIVRDQYPHGLPGVPGS